jgi:dihydrofolate synthase/folylpolyglutamate synthase
MIDTRQQSVAREATSLGKQRNYNEIIDYLDKHWATSRNGSLERTKKLDLALGSPSNKVNTIMVAGTNGKSLTVHFSVKLLREEKLKVGAFYSPHILTYNERLTLNEETISNKLFTELGNEVINATEQLSLIAHSQELLTMMALLYFAQQKVDVAVMEIDEGGTTNPVNICQARVATITRATQTNVGINEEQMNGLIQTMLGIVKKSTYFVSGDQSKAHLHLMQTMTEAQNGIWLMPIRKVAALSYPFEQLHGRCATLAERIAQAYLENFVTQHATILSDSLLVKQKGQRGRPTLEAKRQAELNPRKTIDQFWKETINELPARFQLLDKEKPSILLDTANNIDAFKNLLLGIRLLHYQRPLKGLTIIAAAPIGKLHNEEFLKLVRHFFKKTSGQIFICPIEEALPGIGEDISWDVEQTTNDLKSMKIKARACKSFDEAFEAAKKSVDERYGLVTITGSKSIIQHYWRLKGIKKF